MTNLLSYLGIASSDAEYIDELLNILTDFSFGAYQPEGHQIDTNSIIQSIIEAYIDENINDEDIRMTLKEHICANCLDSRIDCTVDMFDDYDLELSEEQKDRITEVINLETTMGMNII